MLDDEGFDIGAVTGVQGIYWTEYRIEGVANHAGTTPMVFVPSRDGISHNTEEFTSPEQIRAGADVLVNILLDQAGVGR